MRTNISNVTRIFFFSNEHAHKYLKRDKEKMTRKKFDKEICAHVRCWFFFLVTFEIFDFKVGTRMMHCKCTVNVLSVYCISIWGKARLDRKFLRPSTCQDRKSWPGSIDPRTQPPWIWMYNGVQYPPRKIVVFLLFFTIFLLGCYFTIFYLRFALPGSPPLLALQIVSAAGGDVPRVTVCKHGRHGRHGRHRPLIIHRLHRIDIGDFDRQRATRTNFKTQLLNQSHFKIRIAQTYQTK